MNWSPRIELAIETVIEAHGLGRRKAKRGFEAAHVLSVGLITASYGFDEDTVVAALLHDTLEDTELDPEVIRSRFGDLVLQMVRDVSEPPKPTPWQKRKETYIEQIRTTPRLGSLAVASADKIHNLTRMLADLEVRGPAFIDAFNASLKGMLWYQRTIYASIAGRWSHPILEEHQRRLDAFVSAASRPASSTPM